MQRTPLGRTGLEISALGFGALHLSFGERPDEAASIALLHQVFDLGITLIDTADSYCQDESDKHHSEHLLRKALVSYSGERERLVIATKGGLMRTNGEWLNNGDPAYLSAAIRRSFMALGGERPIDLWQLHAPAPGFTIEQSLAPAKAAVEAGLIRHVGVSNFSVEQIKRARSVVEIVSVQNQYNPWCRWPEFGGVIDYCEREGLTFMPWSPFGGLPRAHTLRCHPTLAAFAQERGVSVHAIVIAWLRAKSTAIVPIPGTRRLAALADWLPGLAIRLTPGEVEAIDQSLPHQRRARARA